MTRNGQAGFGRMVLAFGVGALLALAGCDKGPDRAKVAEDLKASVEAQLKDIEGDAQQKYLSHSAVSVTPQEDGTYLVSIEGLRATPAEGGHLDIGTLSYRANPKDETTYEISDLKLPEVMLFKGADGKEEGKLTIKAKAFSGTWSKALGQFQKIEAEFTDIAATDDKGADIRLLSAKIDSGIVDKGGGVSDYVGKAVLGGFTAKDTDNGTFAVAAITTDFKYDSVKVAELQAAVRKYQELAQKQFAFMEAHAATQTPGADGQPTAAPEAGAQPATPDASGQTAPATAPLPLTVEEEKAMTDSIAAMGAAIKGVEFRTTLNDIKYTEGGNTPFSIASFVLGTAIDGINQENATLNFDVGHDGLALATPWFAGKVADAVLPRKGNLGIKVTGIPGKDLVKVLADNLPGMMSTDPVIAGASGEASKVAAGAVFQNAGAKIEVTPSQLLSQLIELKATGAFDVTPQSAEGVVGGLDMAVRGLDDLLALAQQSPDDFIAQQVLGAIGMLQQYSNREQGSDGKPVDQFRIDIGADGQTLVNGKPM